jgi:hypothetical protein
MALEVVARVRIGERDHCLRPFGDGLSLEVDQAVRAERVMTLAGRAAIRPLPS